MTLCRFFLFDWHTYWETVCSGYSNSLSVVIKFEIICSAVLAIPQCYLSVWWEIYHTAIMRHSWKHNGSLTWVSCFSQMHFSRQFCMNLVIQCHPTHVMLCNSCVIHFSSISWPNFCASLVVEFRDALETVYMYHINMPWANCMLLASHISDGRSG